MTEQDQHDEKPHGDPLLASAQGRNDGDDGSRHGKPAPASAHEPDTGLAVATVQADAFCHSMVRALVGAVLPVGAGRRPVDWPAQVLAAGVRDAGVTVVSPAGLTLEEVTYPPDDQLAVRAEQARSTRRLP